MKENLSNNKFEIAISSTKGMFINIIFEEIEKKHRLNEIYGLRNLQIGNDLIGVKTYEKTKNTNLKSIKKSLDNLVSHSKEVRLWDIDEKTFESIEFGYEIDGGENGIGGTCV